MSAEICKAALAKRIDIGAAAVVAPSANRPSASVALCSRGVPGASS
jgi:hypothetical protein